MNESDVRARLSDVRDPDLGDDIVSLGLVNEVDVDADAETVHVSLALGAPFSPTESAIADDVREALADTGLAVELSAAIPDDLSTDEQVLPGVKNIIAVASGKAASGSRRSRSTSRRGSPSSVPASASSTPTCTGRTCRGWCRPSSGPRPTGKQSSRPSDSV